MLGIKHSLLILQISCQPKLDQVVVGFFIIFKRHNICKCWFKLIRKKFSHFLMALTCILFSVGQYFVQKLTHVKVVDVFIDELNHRKDSFMEIADYVYETFNIVSSAGGHQLYHRIRCKQTVSVEWFDFFLSLVLPVFMKDFGDQGKVDDRVRINFFFVADVLKLEVSMSIAELMDDFELGQNLHANVWQLAYIHAFVFRMIIETRFDIKQFKNVLANIRHHNFTKCVRQLSRNDYRKTSIIFEI